MELNWDGATMLEPGGSYGFTLSPLEYTKDISPGEHGIQLEMGGLQSNAIRILWPSK